MEYAQLTFLSSGLHQEGGKYFKVQKWKVTTRFSNSSALSHWK